MSRIEYKILSHISGNVAYNKSVRQSGEWGGHSAVDGRASPSHCADVENPSGEPAWLMVDLGATHQVYNVTVFNTDIRELFTSYSVNMHQ